MLKVVLKLLLCFLAFGLTDVGAYNYDEKIYSEKFVKSSSEANFGWYDASSNPASYKELKDLNFREKTQGGSFLKFFLGQAC